MQLSHLISKAEQYFVDVVDSGSDQDLFIAGYVQGHFSLALAKLQSCDDKSAEQLTIILDNSLTQAFADNELDLDDQAQCRKLVEQLVSR
ncbi:MAG: YfcL family protein [Paraglaciecola sp.]|uniref:YfcL family protein n=1 Tax=Flavobacterium sp. W21_SRS_FM6 TaxID=3240268 RepID=UPI00276122CE|nr:YfcL family protein [Paraglaciecola sp.]